MENSAPVRSVEKALNLLDAIVFSDVAGDGKTLKELADAFGLPVNTAHNLLRSLEVCGYVMRHGRGIYGAGPKCARMGRAVLASSVAGRERIVDELKRFAETEAEAAVCTILLEGERVLVAKVEGNQAVQVAHSVVEQGPFFAKPTGRVLAAVADEAELEKIVQRQGYPGDAWDGIVRRSELDRALEGIREEGVSVVRQEDLVAVACPVYQSNGAPWGAIGTYAPSFRCGAARQRELVAALKGAARAVSSVLGAI